MNFEITISSLPQKVVIPTKVGTPSHATKFIRRTFTLRVAFRKSGLPEGILRTNSFSVIPANAGTFTLTRYL